MKINPFRMERWQSTWENRVQFNLSESGVHPMTPAELLELAGADAQDLLSQRLIYNQSNGTVELRELVAAIYPGATIDNVLVSNGGSEANYVTTWKLLDPDDVVVMQAPNYMQIWGQGENFAREVRPFHLLEERGWAPDLDELDARVDGDVKLIVVTNPNNPTGAILTEAEIDRIVAIAERAGAWIIADEIYAGAELDGTWSPSFWDRYDRLVITAGLSKAYGLPGLRIGWAVGPADFIADLWSYKDYTSIAPGTLSDLCARIALNPETRPRIYERTRGILSENLQPLEVWLSERPDTFRYLPPRAGAICYTRYDLSINSSELAQRLKDEQSVLIVPGDHFNMDGYMRIGYGVPRPQLIEALDRIETVIRSVAS
ncbi:MAG: aminotransferase class I/II-fold pyridoxal phosphate-dependent enzyme [Gemmatimonadota bacterium]|nr:MAG: aminotransferase class I/II-fold pyridoxal phosphate-dependent enzyme [Gemmatimonadota bacterium]